jgi:GNAT superfamily N-acetyltransferase
MASPYAIRPATLAELPALGAIETRAAELYRGLVPDEVTQDNVPEAVHRAAAAAGRLFVAEASDGSLVGFALVILLEDGSAHLEELDVLPEHGRRGVGTALIEASCRWAKLNGHTGLTLTTYRDVAFNAPLYLRRGFRVLHKGEIASGLLGVVEREHQKGLDVAARVAMRRDF